MITKNQATHLSLLIRRLVGAEILHAEKGTHPPADWMEVASDLAKAEEQLKKYIVKLQMK